MDRARTILITGGNAGIGFAAAEQLARAGHHVVIGCRDEQRGAAAARAIQGAAVRVLPIDLASQASVRRAAAQLDAVDSVIHNAAFFDIAQKQRVLTAESVEQTWATNHLGPVLLTELLLPKLLASGRGRVVAVTSKGLMMHPRQRVALDDVEFKQGGFTVPRAYYQSKLAQLAWLLSLAEAQPALKVHGVRVTNVKIDVARYPNLSAVARAMYAMKSRFAITPARMAETYSWLAADPTVDDLPSGGYWDDVHKLAPLSSWAKEPEHRAALWTLTRQTLGLA